MKPQIHKWLALVAMLFSLFFVVTNASAKKPVKPPPNPEPGDGGAACVDSGSYFPAFVYKFSNEFYLSNSEGDCRILIYTMDEGSSNPSYRFFGDLVQGNGTGKIVWNARSFDFKAFGGFSPSKIYLLEFEVEGGAITTPLPMTPRTLLIEPEPWGNVYSPDLSPSGDKVIVASYAPGELEGFIWEFEIPESSQDDPIPAWSWDTLFHFEVDDSIGLENATPHLPRYGLLDQRNRIYFEYDYPDRKLVFIEQNLDGTWTEEPTLIVERESRGAGLGTGSVGLWSDGSGVKEVIAHPAVVSDVGVVEILDVDTCIASDPPGSGEGCVMAVVEGRGGDSSFTTYTSGPLPALLYLYDVDLRNVGYSIRECNLDRLIAGDDCYRTVIEAIKNPKESVAAVDSAD